MKNIYNLLTDAFDKINKHESDYKVVVKDYYNIKITSFDTESTGFASLNLIMRSNGTLFDVHDTNTLFTDEEWYDFCLVIDRQIPQSFLRGGELLNLPPLINQTVHHSDEEADDSELVYNDHRNLTVDTTIGHYIDMASD